MHTADIQVTTRSRTAVVELADELVDDAQCFSVADSDFVPGVLPSTIQPVRTACLLLLFAFSSPLLAPPDASLSASLVSFSRKASKTRLSSDGN